MSVNNKASTNKAPSNGKAASANPKQNNRDLPPKESSLFKAILKFYEHKQHKKGLKNAEQILKRYPNHGETLAMKGLFLSNLDRKEEAYQFIKDGLRNDLTSHICWHVYGLIYRGDKNYDEAIKCYINALKFDKENIQILRDLSLLQVQMRNYDGFVESRQKLLNLKPENRQYWFGLVVAFHLQGDYEKAEKALSAYETTITPNESDPLFAFEQSEILMYKSLIIEESGDYARALSNLDTIKPKVVDVLAWKEARARIQLKLKNFDSAETMYRNLISRNPDCKKYCTSLQEVLDLSGPTLDEHQITKLCEVFDELRRSYPRSHTIRRIPLYYTSGEDFKARIDEYLQEGFRKGIPSLFVSFTDLYDGSVEKAQIIENLVEGYRAQVLSGVGLGDDNVIEPPTTLLWVNLYLAQHYDRKRQYGRALELIEEAIEHSPTLVEAIMIKAKIFKHLGDSAKAAEVMNHAREMDLQDRNVNSKATRYLLRNDQIAEAEKTITLFTRAESPNPLGDLVDMQCMWFALGCAESHLRKKSYGPALKKLHQIEKHFNDIYDDQFDFHTYNMRKVTLAAYIDLIRTEDKIKSHPFFVRAAILSGKAYLELWESELKKKNDAIMEETALAKMSPADRKKAARKARKAELKDSTPTTPSAAEKENSIVDKKKKDEDPEGLMLTQSGTDFLGEALTRFLKPLMEASPKNIDGWNLGAAAYIRKRKFIPALRCLKKANSIDTANSDFFENVVHFIVEIQKQPPPTSEPNSKLEFVPVSVISTILKQLPEISSEAVANSVSIPQDDNAVKKLNMKELLQFIRTFADKNKDKPKSLVSVGRAMDLLAPYLQDQKEAVKSEIIALLTSINVEKPVMEWEDVKSGVKIEEAINILEFLQAKSEDEANAFRLRCKKVFPLTPYFQVCG